MVRSALVTKAYYIKLLEKHDWFYEFNEDPSGYEASSQMQERLVDLSFTSEEFSNLYYKYNPLIIN